LANATICQIWDGIRHGSRSPAPDFHAILFSCPAIEKRVMKQRSTSNFRQPRVLWTVRREAALNWLALGLLLAAWNAADNGEASDRRKPDSLRGYSAVSVRAAQRAGALT
jgi:hypothetical protein